MVQIEKNKIIWEIFTVLLIIFSFIFHLSNLNKLNLVCDEAYFWEWSRHLSISYSDQGPILGLLIYISTKIFGNNSEFAVRFFSVLLASGISILVYLITKIIFKNSFSCFISVFTLIFIPVFSFGSMTMTADIPMVFFWTVSIYFIIKIITQKSNENTKEKSYLWYLTGISTALGIMSKYTMIIFIPSVFLAMIISKKQRIWLKTKYPYIALFISLTGFIPPLIYNTKNNWPTYGYIKSLFYSGSLSFAGVRGISGILEYIAGQMAIVTPLLGLFFIYLFFKLYIKGIKQSDDPIIFLFIFSYLILAGFGIMSYFSSVEENWPAPAYISLSIVTGGVFSGTIFKNNKFEEYIKGVIIAGLIICFFTTTILYVHSMFFSFKLPKFLDPADRAKGWKQLGFEMSVILRDNPGKIFLLSNYYGTAAELAFYMENQPEILCVDVGHRLREYRYWSKFENLKGYDAFYISAFPVIEPVVNSLFDSIKFYWVINIYRDEENIRNFYVFYCKNFKGDYETPKSPEFF